MEASDWHSRRFTMIGGSPYFVPNEEIARKRWEETYTECLSKYPRQAASDLLVITNIGTHTAIPVVNSEFERYLNSSNATAVGDKVTIPAGLLRGFLLQLRLEHLMLVRRFVDRGFRVVWVTDPPLQVIYPEIFAIFDKILAEAFARTGCSIFNVRQWIEGMGVVPHEFYSTEIDPVSMRTDWLHGSPEYYRRVLTEIFDRHSFTPQYLK